MIQVEDIRSLIGSGGLNTRFVATCTFYDSGFLTELKALYQRDKVIDSSKIWFKKELFNEKLNRINFILKSFQIPGISLEETTPNVKDRTYINKSTKGALTATLYNDQYDFTYEFWKTYVDLFKGCSLRYPEEYMFYLTLYYNVENNKAKQIIFSNCFLKNFPDLDLSQENNLTELQMEFNYEYYDISCKRYNIDELSNNTNAI